MIRFAHGVALATLLPLGALAQGLDTATYQACMAGCDTALDACCVQSCGYRACIAAGAGGTSLFSNMGGTQGDIAEGAEALADPAAAQAAVAACMPHVDALQKCRAAEARARTAAKPEAPPPVPFIDMPCCRYWTEERGGKIVVRGWYVTEAGRRFDYTSEPVEPIFGQATTWGMFALTNGIGYHIYSVDEGQGLEQIDKLYYVTRFGPNGVENLYILRIGGRFSVRLNDDMSGGYVIYNTPFARDAFWELPLK